jgi:hypothetical protein
VGSGVAVIGLSVMPSSPPVWQENAGGVRAVEITTRAYTDDRPRSERDGERH